MKELKKGTMTPTFKVVIEQAKALANDQSALAEFIDNSIDAGSGIIGLETIDGDSDFDIHIRDDGCGMTYKNLISSLKSGQSIKNNQDRITLGCKGQGMKTAATKLANGLRIYSKTVDSDTIAHGFFDLRKMKSHPNNNDWESLYRFSEKSLSDVPVKVGQFFETTNSGTYIILEEVPQRKKAFDKRMVGTVTSSKSIGMIYRHILSTGLRISYAGEFLSPAGPGFYRPTGDGPKDKVFFTDEYDGGWIPHSFHIGGSIHDCRFRYVRKADKNHWGTASAKGGLRILRNKRDITQQLITGIRPSDWNVGHLIIEMDCPSSFIDFHLSMAVDKQIRTIESVGDWDFKEEVKKIVRKHCATIIPINQEDAFKYGEKQPQSRSKNIPSERVVIDRFVKSSKETYASLRGLEPSDKEIEGLFRREYVLEPTKMRVDLMVDEIPHEFKTGEDSQVTGQILSYVPYLIQEGIAEGRLKPKDKLKYVLVTPHETESLKDQVAMANKFSWEGIGLEIQIRSGGWYFEHRESAAEKRSRLPS